MLHFMVLDRQRIIIAAVLTGIIAAIAVRSPLPAVGAAQAQTIQAQTIQGQAQEPLYENRAVHDPNGTGKFYMGREVAQVMGPGGIPWLDRPVRESEEKPAEVIKAMQLQGNEVIADLGAGSGYFTFRLAAKAGRILAVEIQDEMIATLRQRAAEQKLSNVEVIKGTECDPHLPAAGVDLVLMVDVYHELSCPFEVMTEVRKALRPTGRVMFVEYRKEDPSIAIKEVHKMSVAQLEKEMAVVRLRRLQTVEVLPLQHIVIFGKNE